MSYLLNKYRMHTRREFTQALGGLSLVSLSPASLSNSILAPRIDSTISGVIIGAITYSFRAIDPQPGQDYLQVGIDGCVRCGLGSAELWANMVQPASILKGGGQYDFNVDSPEMLAAREQLRQWRLTTSRAFWRNVRRRFDAAGIDLFAYSLTLGDDFTDAEIEATFNAMHAMGVRILGTNQTRVAMARRVVPFAERHRVTLGFHNHSHVDKPNEIATIESMETVLAMSPSYKINLDIGHFVGANLDPVAFIQKHHTRITHLHLKDRKRDDGPNVPWGQGDTPIKEVLQLVKTNRYPLRCLIEYEYASDRSPLVEVARCMDYIRQALA